LFGEKAWKLRLIIPKWKEKERDLGLTQHLPVYHPLETPYVGVRISNPAAVLGM
jgi:hypothetical protein